jgi:acyl carrier protein
VLRGGSFNNQAVNVRPANRNRNAPANRNNNSGFRPASTLRRTSFVRPESKGPTTLRSVPGCKVQVAALCRIADVPFATGVALAVRCEVADRAGLPPHSVRAADRLPEDLGDLFTRESPDAVKFVMRLEEQFGVTIPDRAAEVFTRESVSVAELASGLCRGAVVRRRWW